MPNADQPYAGELVEVEGLLDLRDDGYGFLRTKGYHPSPNDVYVSINQARRFHLRKGDTIVGGCRPAACNEKYPALLRIDSVAGLDPEVAKLRPRFEDLTPLFPDEKLKLETNEGKDDMTPRIVDLLAPIGKGQRGLIVSPPKAGKTTIMKQIAQSIEANNPEVHLMVLLVDERPEEVTDMRRSVKGEVVASTFDRPAEEHTHVAELCIERAKRLVEQGRDVVIILDGITRLARAYNLGRPGDRPHHVRWRRLGRAVPAQEVLRRRAQHRRGRFADHPRDRPRRDRLQDGRGHLRGVQGHRQHGAAPRPPPRRASDLPGDRRQRAPRRATRSCSSAATRCPRSGSCAASSTAWPPRAATPPGSSCSIDKIKTTKSNDEFLAEIAKAPRRPADLPLNFPSHQGALMKPDIHPEYGDSDRHLLVRQHLHDRSPPSRPARRAVQRVPPVLHRQAEARRHRWPRRALPASLRPEDQGAAPRRLGPRAPRDFVRSLDETLDVLADELRRDRGRALRPRRRRATSHVCATSRGATRS